MKKAFKSLLALLLASIIIFCVGCENSPTDSSDAKTESSESTKISDYTVQIITEGGKALEGVRVTIGCNTDGLIWTGVTDEDGKCGFTTDKEGIFAKLNDVPEGYELSEKYPISQADSKIVLKTALLDAGDMTGYTCSLGDVARDFEITDVKGNTHKISELLKTKNAVVLNFWFINCGPCKSEFPFLQKAYEEYKDDIEIIAVNPVDGTDSSIAEYAENLGLTFPTASGVDEWNSCMGISAFPTTVVIDRYGTIAFYHRGAVYEEGIFEKIFGFFASDDYKQTTIRNISDIPQQ